MANGRIIAIGDIHGYSAALRALLGAIGLQPQDTLVTLGDYVDRGPDSRGVVDVLISLKSQCRLVPILGNHDLMFLEICTDDEDLLDSWLPYGGDATVASYGGKVPQGVPDEHIEFLRDCRLLHEEEGHFFVHASYLADLPLSEQPSDVMLWESLKSRIPRPHRSGKTAIVGHTAQRTGDILDLGYLKCIDTCCYAKGWLTAMDMESGQLWQADKEGRLRAAK